MKIEVNITSFGGLRLLVFKLALFDQSLPFFLAGLGFLGLREFEAPLVIQIVKGVLGGDPLLATLPEIEHRHVTGVGVDYLHIFVLFDSLALRTHVQLILLEGLDYLFRLQPIL